MAASIDEWLTRHCNDYSLFCINCELLGKHGNCKYQTTPALCNIITPFRGRYAASPASRNFQNIISACLAYWMIPSAAWCYWRLNDRFCSERRSNAAGIAAAKIVSAFEWPGQPPKIVPSLLGDLHPRLIRGSLGPPESFSKTAFRSLQPFLHSLP